jgi:hypothetical protein
MRKWGLAAVLSAVLVTACGRPAPLQVKQIGLPVAGDVLGAFGPGSPLLAPILPPGITPFGGGATASADGRWLAYQVPSFGSWDIYLLDTLTGQINTLPNLNSQRMEVNPIISPDGLTITFLSDRNGFLDTFIYDRVSQTYRPLSFSYFAAFGAPSLFGPVW